MKLVGVHTQSYFDKFEFLTTSMLVGSIYFSETEFRGQNSEVATATLCILPKVDAYPHELPIGSREGKWEAVALPRTVFQSACGQGDKKMEAGVRM